MMRYFEAGFMPKLLLGMVIALFVLGVQPTAVVYAAAITVDTTDDDLTVNGNCTLREAIQAANTDTAVDNCPAGTVNDVITVPAGTYLLTIGGTGEDSNAGGDLDITSNITINGVGARNTIIDGNNIDRVLHVVSNAGATVELNDLTITNGQLSSGTGTGIQVDSGNTLLTINESAITNHNTSNFGTGVGFYSFGADVLVQNSTLSGNSSPDGLGAGGAVVSADLTLVNSTVSNNDVTGGGGFGFGAGISSSNGSLLVRNSTFSGNSSPDGTLDFAGTSSNVENTILTNNSGGDCNSFITVDGNNNLIDDATCGGSAGRVGTVTNFDTVLQNNGGPTDTHALNVGSNAIDTGINGCDNQAGTDLAIDQRGAARPFNGTCDIGAYEYRAPVTNCALSTGSSIAVGAVTFDFTVLGTVTCVTVEQMNANHPAATINLNTGDWWRITANGTGFDTAVTLPYAAANTDSRACRYPGSLGGGGWDCAADTHVPNSSVTRNNVTAFSDWTVGQPAGPTAVTMQDSFTATVFSSHLWISAGFILLLLGSGFAWHGRRRT